MAIDYQHFKQKLETEKATVEKELEEVGRRNPDNPSDWQATPPDDRDVSQADDNTVADSVEGYEENVALVGTLETRYREVKAALERIEKGTYGVCSVGGEEIESDRLEANPAANTCKKHME